MSMMSPLHVHISYLTHFDDKAQQVLSVSYSLLLALQPCISLYLSLCVSSCLNDTPKVSDQYVQMLYASIDAVLFCPLQKCKPTLASHECFIIKFHSRMVGYLQVPTVSCLSPHTI